MYSAFIRSRKSGRSPPPEKGTSGISTFAMVTLIAFWPAEKDYWPPPPPSARPLAAARPSIAFPLRRKHLRSMILDRPFVRAGGLGDCGSGIRAKKIIFGVGPARCRISVVRFARGTVETCRGSTRHPHAVRNHLNLPAVHHAEKTGVAFGIDFVAVSVWRPPASRSRQNRCDIACCKRNNWRRGNCSP